VLLADESFSERVEATVTELEQRTDAEIVVVVAARSGEYRDLAFGAATAATFALLVVLDAVPFAIHPWAVVADLAIAWPLTAWVATSDRVTRWLLSATRADDAVLRAAAAAFYEEGVHATPNRTGVLVYVSTVEGRVKLVPDIGLEAHIPPGRFGEATRQFAHDDLDHFLAGLRALGDVLAERVPHTQASDAVDLPNTPRIRP
jgi:putative membrane protein